jgi:acetylornithine deacetylase
MGILPGMTESSLSLAADKKLLGQLMAIDTTSGQPSDLVLEIISEKLQAVGCEVHRLEGASDGRGNLIAIAGPVGVEGGLTLSGHIDTVPAGEGWSTDPRTLVERDGRWYGRGSCDMTGFVAMATNLLAEATSLQRPLALVLTADEELGSIGAGALVDQAAQLPPLPKACIVGEPTSLRVVRLHKGHLKFTITVSGATGHTGMPVSGVNAINGLRHALDSIEAERSRLEGQRTNESAAFSRVPFPVLAPVRLDAGCAWNVIPSEASVDLGLRVLPDQCANDVLEEIRTALDVAMRDWPLAWSLDIYNDNPPMCTQRGAEIDVACRALVGQDQDIGVSYCSDGGHLSKLGLECVLFGPGDIAVAHRPDEFVPIEDMVQARGYLKRLISARCGENS